MANHGITDPEVLVRHAAELIEEGITTTRLGYGAEFHEAHLTALADAGRGTAYHLETADPALAISASELEASFPLWRRMSGYPFAPGSLAAV